MSIDHKIAYLAVTPKGTQLAKRLRALVGTGEVYTTKKLESEEVLIYEESLSQSMASLFQTYDYLVCIMATGIVVRAIAPYLVDKLKDPGVLVIDELGKHVISLLSGHVGGANALCQYISELLGAEPVITTATDVHEKAALDEIAKSLNAYIEDFKAKVKAVNYALVCDKNIGIYNETPKIIDTRGLIPIKSQEELVKGKSLEQLIYVSTALTPKLFHPHMIQVIPRSFVLGVGCRQGVDPEYMKTCMIDYMARQDLSFHSLAGVGSIELKKEEPAIIELARFLQVPFEVYSTAALTQVENLFSGSDFVKAQVGVSAVAAPVAYLMCKGHKVTKREKYKGITFALGHLES